MDLKFLYSEIGLGTTTWSPLSSGFLTGKYNEGIPENSRANLPGYEQLKERFLSNKERFRIDRIQNLQRIAHELGITLAEMAIAWCLKNPNVSTVILGASNPKQIQMNLGALKAQETLIPEVMERIESVLQNQNYMPEYY